MLEKLGLFPETTQDSTQVIFINFGETEALYCMKAIKELRGNGVNAELYPSSAKMKKQMNYANKRSIPYVVLVGSQEIESNLYTVKNMENGDQQTLNLDGLLLAISK